MKGWEKLEKVADFVEGLDPRRLEMGHWFNSDDELEEEDLAASLLDTSCNTTACFLGWATTVLPDDLAWAGCGHAAVGDPVLKNDPAVVGVAAAATVFGIDGDEARWLCGLAVLVGAQDAIQELPQPEQQAVAVHRARILIEKYRDREATS